jgi:hypothetical protein
MTTFTETRQLLLDTADIGWHVAGPPSQTSYQADPYINPNVGEVNNRLTDALWYRIDMKRLLGEEMWSNYGQFNVLLRNWTVNNCADIGSNNTTNGENFNDRSLFICMSGPHWVNNYSTKSRQYEREAILGIYSTTNVGASEGFSQNFFGSIQTFDKNNGPIIDIRLRLLRTVDSQPPVMNGNTSNTAPTNYPFWSMIFDIVPVDASRTSRKNFTAF